MIPVEGREVDIVYCVATRLEFIFQFMGPVFEGEDEVFIDLAFDTGVDSSGDATEFWRSMKPEYVEFFRPDVKVTISGSGGQVRGVSFYRWQDGKMGSG